MANTSAEIEMEVTTRAGLGGAILFYDRQRRLALKRMPLHSPFVLPRVGELVRLPIENDVATEYCVVDIRYLYRDSAAEQMMLECSGRARHAETEERGMYLECVRVELDPLL